MLDLTPLLADASSDLLAARNQMAFTLGFHIILASLGVAFPAIMLIAEYRGRKHGDADAMLLARRWSKVVAVTFAVGAVTGTVLSFEMGLLWPEFMGASATRSASPSRSRGSSSSPRRSSSPSTSTAGSGSGVERTSGPGFRS